MQVHFGVLTALNVLLSAELAALYAFHMRTHQVAVYGVRATPIGLSLLMPWSSPHLWR